MKVIRQLPKQFAVCHLIDVLIAEAGNLLEAVQHQSYAIAPAALAAGTNSRLRAAPALKKAMSMPVKASAASSSTLYDLPRNSRVLPTERVEEVTGAAFAGEFQGGWR